MIPVSFPEQNRIIKAPADRPNAHDLPVNTENGINRSVWQMSPEELALANANGGRITLIVVGPQPAVALKVDQPTLIQEATAEPVADPPAT